MRNKVVKKLLMIAMAVTMISGTSLATVYANANPPAEETTTAVVEETTTEKSKDTEKAEDTGRVTGESNNSAFSTPGNAQLVDDKENDDTKQFLTIQTKKGNTFYMVIDRSSNTEKQDGTFRSLCSNRQQKNRNKKKRMLSNEMRTQQWVTEFKQYRNIKSLDRKTVVMLIDRIVVYSTDRIEIHFNYEDEITEFVKYAFANGDLLRKVGEL